MQFPAAPPRPRCGICSHAKRGAIEQSIADGGATLDVAYQFAVSKLALDRHISTHETLPVRAAEAAPPAAECPTVPSVRAAPPAAYADVPTTASAQIGALVKSIRDLVADVQMDKSATYSDKSSLLRTSLQALNLLAKLTGELGASEATVVASPHWKRLRSDVLDALRPYPDALAAVHDRLAALEVAA